MKSFLIISGLLLSVFLSFSVGKAANIAPVQGLATANSTYLDWDPQNAIDRNSTTGWSSGGYAYPTDPDWLIVDLQKPFQITRIDLLFWQYNGSPYFGYTNEYNLYTSVDGTYWYHIGSGVLTEHTDPKFYTATFTISGGPLRYVKYEVVGGSHWAGIVEVMIYDTSSSVPIPGAVWLLLD